MNRSSSLLALGALLLSTTAAADLLTYDFTAVNFGRFDLSDDTSLHLPAGFAEGAIATGFITFETSVADGDLADPTRGWYPNAIVDFQVTIDGYLFQFDPTRPGASNQIVVRDRIDPQRDIIGFGTRDGYSTFSPPAGSGYSFDMGLQTVPSQGLQLAGDGLVANLNSIPEWWLTWTVAAPALTEDNVSSGSIALVTSLIQRPAASVPEPSAAVLLLTGMLGLAARRKRP